MDRTRLRLNFIDSPSFANESGPAFSPMTNLALNLSDTTLSATPRRKLSMCSNEDTPPTHRIKSLQSDLSDVTMEPSFTERVTIREIRRTFRTSLSGDRRLLKNVIKFPGSPAQPPTRGRTLPRRIMSPSLAGAQPHVSNSTSDKENRSTSSPAPMAPEDTPSGAPFLSPAKPSSPAHASPARFLSPLRMRQPLEDHDPNSQDSGYSPVFVDKDDKSGFRFMEPVGTAPRRQLSLLDQSPCKDMLTGSPRSRSSGCSSPPFFHSLSSGSASGTESIDDGFVEFLDGEKPEESQYPTGMGSLLSCPLKEQNAKKETNVPDTRPKPSFRRSLSLNEASTRVSRCPFGVPSLNERDDAFTASETVRVFKRPEPPCENSSVIHCLKRPKINPLPLISEDSAGKSVQKCVSETVRLQRSFSVSEATIKRALQRSSQDPDLIGDFSKPFILPLMQGRHQDLKTISSDTLANLLQGEYNDAVESYAIIDCRYPYEFNGGHIRGARNIYLQDQITKEFVEKKPVFTCKRNILIFHCEFSSERGPKLSRFLRNSDRVLNKELYPALHYPEVYLLHGGYKEFFERHSELCEPCSYLPMAHPNHEADLRHFRAKTKSGDCKTRHALRSNLKRLGL